jgi:hypothetical protein
MEPERIDREEKGAEPVQKLLLVAGIHRREKVVGKEYQ